MTLLTLWLAGFVFTSGMELAHWLLGNFTAPHRRARRQVMAEAFREAPLQMLAAFFVGRAGWFILYPALGFIIVGQKAIDWERQR